jgi:outer membrane immunogenic protein
MRNIASTLLIATGLSVALVQVSLAADLPRRPAYTAPILAPAPVYSWTGFYVGGNLGGAFGNVEVTNVNTGATTSPNSSGFAGGGQVGFDYQMGPWVIGIRNLIDGTDLSKSTTFSGSTFSGTINSHANWFDALTARGGYLVQPNLLLYVQGGAAWTQWNVTFNSSGAQVGEIGGNSNTGWTVGGGIEWMFVPHWSAFLEYNYMGFGTFSNAVATCVGATCGTFSGKADLQNVLVGVNYRF